LTSRDGTSAWVNGVQTQAGRLIELLKTRAFLTDVAQRTSLATARQLAAGQRVIADLIGRT